MKTSLVAFAVAVLAPILGVSRSTAQVQPFRLQFNAPEFSLRLRPAFPLNQLPPALVQVNSAAAVECPMPVYVPDLSHVERMPVAPLNPTGHAIRIAPIRCVNPLGPQAAVVRAPSRPPNP